MLKQQKKETGTNGKAAGERLLTSLLKDYLFAVINCSMLRLTEEKCSVWGHFTSPNNFFRYPAFFFLHSFDRIKVNKILSSNLSLSLNYMALLMNSALRLSRNCLVVCM